MTFVPYHHIKTNALSVKEKQRLRIAIGSELRIKNQVKHPSSNYLINELTGLCKAPLTNTNNELLDWLLCYGRPSLVNQLMVNLSSFETENLVLQTIKQADKSHFLVKEYINPDLQKIQLSPKPQNALICFTGGTHRLNIPVQLFHFFAVRYFDLIFYLKDFSHQCFTAGIPTIATDIQSLSTQLYQQIPPNCHTVVLGTSAGGYAAASFAEVVPVNRLVLFSPPFFFENRPAITNLKMHPKHVKLFFAAKHNQDCRFSTLWSKTRYTSSIRSLDTDTHGTLKYLFMQKQLEAIFHWMLG